MSTLVMAGLENLEGGQTNTLHIGRMLRRRPEPLYETRCSQCDAVSSATHTRLRNGAATCRAAACGKPTKSSDRYDRLTEREAAAERENARIAEEREASARRMEAESAGWERPTKYKPLPTPYEPRSDRERMEIRERRAAEEAAQRAADAPRLEAERKQQERIAELQSEQQSTLRQLHTIERERVATGKDDSFAIDPATIGDSASVPANKVDAWHAAQSTQFLADNPSYFPCKENETTILAFIERNAPGLKLLSASQLTAAYRRLRDFGLLKERPAPQPTPEPQFTSSTRSTTAPKQAANPKDEVVDGWEIDGSAPRKWTQRQLDRLSADDYRRALHLYREHIQMPGRLI